jgi:hypothetical protein
MSLRVSRSSSQSAGWKPTGVREIPGFCFRRSFRSYSRYWRSRWGIGGPWLLDSLRTGGSAYSAWTLVGDGESCGRRWVRSGRPRPRVHGDELSDSRRGARAGGLGKDSGGNGAPRWHAPAGRPSPRIAAARQIETNRPNSAGTAKVVAVVALPRAGRAAGREVASIERPDHQHDLDHHDLGAPGPTPSARSSARQISAVVRQAHAHGRAVGKSILRSSRTRTPRRNACRPWHGRQVHSPPTCTGRVAGSMPLGKVK